MVVLWVRGVSGQLVAGGRSWRGSRAIQSSAGQRAPPAPGERTLHCAVPRPAAQAPRDKLLCLVNVKTMVENIVGEAAKKGVKVGGGAGGRQSAGPCFAEGRGTRALASQGMGTQA